MICLTKIVLWVVDRQINWITPKNTSINLKTYSLVCPYLHFGIALCMYGCMSVTSFVSRTFTF